MIKEYKLIKDNYSWADESNGELMYAETAKCNQSPKIYDLRTPLKKSRKDDTDNNMTDETISIIEFTELGLHTYGKEATSTL